MSEEHLLKKIQDIINHANQSERLERILEEGLQDLSRRFDLMQCRCEKHLEANGNLRVETEGRLSALETSIPKNLKERLQAFETGAKIYTGGIATGVALFVSCAWSIVLWLLTKKG